MVNFARSKTFYPINSAVLWAIVFLIIQQLIVASSTIWIARLIANIQAGTFVFSLLVMYLLSLLLPYFPGAAALIAMTKAKAKANIQFVQAFTNNHFGKVVEWSNASHHTSKTSVLTGEAPQTINGYLDYLYHFYSCSLNVAFNLLALAIIVEPLLLFSYGVGITFALVILRFQSKWKRILALRAQQGRIKWFSMLLKAWDNVLLGNTYNFNIWKQKTEQRSVRYESSSVKLMGFSQSISIGMAFVLLGPTFILISYLTLKNSQNLTWLAIVVVTLPRMFQVLSYSYEMLFVLADFPMQKSRLKTVTKLLEIPEHDASNASILESRIQWDKINVTSESQSFVAKELLESLPSKGRFTLRGENGSGKTSLLLLLKNSQVGTSYYLPVKHSLLFAGADARLSTGQWARKTLQELIDKDIASIILLDEWDANLDEKNREKISSLIDLLASNRLVIESRHKI